MEISKDALDGEFVLDIPGVGSHRGPRASMKTNIAAEVNYRYTAASDRTRERLRLESILDGIAAKVA